jgi:hypothetical protein
MPLFIMNTQERWKDYPRGSLIYDLSDEEYEEVQKARAKRRRQQELEEEDENET